MQMTNDKCAEHENIALQLVQEIAACFSDTNIVKDSESVDVLMDVTKQVALLFNKTYEAGRREATEGSTIKETIAYKCGYDSGRSELLAEVVPVLTWYGDEDNHEKYMEQFTFTNHAPLEIETTKVHEDFGKRARALLAKIKAEGDKNG
jgi:hypothetical protein